ncbi:hypothetical protein ACKVEX_08850 [Rhodocyclaceae bacterium SMB388]
MSPKVTFLALLAVTALVHVDVAAATEPVRPVTGAEAQPASGRCLPSEPTVREGMEAIRTHVEAALTAAGGRDMDPDELVTLARTIDGKLPGIRAEGLPKPCHRQFLLITDDISNGTDLMIGAQRVEAQRMGLMTVVQALNLYGRRFDHPDWHVLSYVPGRKAP